MKNIKLKNFNPLTEAPVKIDFKYNKKALTRKQVFNKEEIVMKSTDVKTSYLIFQLQEIKEKYKISYEKILVLLYLQELGLFSDPIKVFGEKIKLAEFIHAGYMAESFNNKSTVLYKLTDRGVGIVLEFNSLVDNNEGNIMKNRSTDLSLEAKTKGVLADFYS